jgi:alkaline phosphatase
MGALQRAEIKKAASAASRLFAIPAQSPSFSGMSLNRRQFFSRSGLLTASAIGFPALLTSSEAAVSRPDGRPRRIIHLVSDGMSMGTFTCADHLSQLARKRPLAWADLCKHPGAQMAWMDMRSLNSTVTDSAAAASTWGSGSRIANGALNMLPDGRKLRTLYELLGEAGWKRGLATTTEITHATPAGFAAQQASRGNGDAIAVDYFNQRVEVLMGGGEKFFTPAGRADKRDLKSDFETAGYNVVRTLPELQAIGRRGRLLGIFNSGHLPYSVDHYGNAKALANIPTLATMTRAALEILRQDRHFILQVEGGRVDHGCHSNDAAAAFYDQLAFDDALEICLEFQKESPDTLIIVTTDHGNANPALNGMGSDYKESPNLFANLQKFRCSNTTLLGRLEKAGSPAEARTLIEEATGYRASSEKIAMLMPFIEKKGKVLYDSMNSASGQLGQLLGNYIGVGWTGGAHTSDYVPLLALGPGSGRFRGFIQGPDVFHHYLALANIRFRNPELPISNSGGLSAAHAEFGHSCTADCGV